MKTNRILFHVCLLGAVLLQAATSKAQPLTNIAGGEYHSLFLKSGGSLWAVGYNADGELGDGTTNNTDLPEAIVSSNVTAIAAGGYHNLFLKSDGSLWAMGYNFYGELGDGTYNATNRPEQIVASDVTAIAAGGYFSLFLKNDGSLWAMGDNIDGELGDGTTDGGKYQTNRPEQIVASNVTAIAAGRYHSLFLKNDGSLWTMGYNGYGELGDGTTNSIDLPEQIVASNVTAIAGGRYHTLFLKSDGSLWAMGENFDGQLGDGTQGGTVGFTNRPEQIVTSNVTAIAGGRYHSLFLKSDGSLWAMGFNGFGELGNGIYYGAAYLPEQIVASDVTAISAGDYHSLFLRRDGSLWAMGYNLYGQLGDGTYSNTNRPVQILAAYNQIFGQLLPGRNMQLSSVGIAKADYALDRSTSLSPPNWIPQLTNPAGSFGALMFTNQPDAATNNFWRIRSVP